MVDVTGFDDVAPLLAELALSARRSTDFYLAKARATLLAILARPALLDHAPLMRDIAGYTRNLLFGADQISVWVMVWAPGSATTVHDHHCSCCFGVVSGYLRETWHRAISDTHAVPVSDELRALGYVGCMLPSGPNLHGMANDGSDEAISIHVYGYDHRTRSSSVHRTYAVASA